MEKHDQLDSTSTRSCFVAKSQDFFFHPRYLHCWTVTTITSSTPSNYYAIEPNCSKGGIIALNGLHIHLVFWLWKEMWGSGIFHTLDQWMFQVNRLPSARDTQHEILKRPSYQLFLHCAAVPTIMCVTPYNNLSICSEGSKGMTSSLPLLSEMCSSVFGICVVVLLYAAAL